MDFAATFNKRTSAFFDVDTTGYTFTKLGTLYAKNGAGKIYKIDGLFIPRGGIEPNAVIINSEAKALISLPAHMYETARAILNNAEAIDIIKRGAVGFTIHQYEAHARDCYGIKFKNL